MYILSVKKQETGQKTGKNPPKKVVFPAPPISWLSLSQKGPDLFRTSQKGPDLFGTSQKGPDLFRTSEKGPDLFRISKKGPDLFGMSGKGPGPFLLEQNRTQIWYFSSGWICWKHHKLLLLNQIRPLLYLRLSWAWRIT